MLLKSLVSYLKDKERPDKVYIVETETGDESLEQALKSCSTFPYRDLTRSCVGCTSLSTSFLSVLHEFGSSFLPNFLLIECSPLKYKFIYDTAWTSTPGRVKPQNLLVVDALAWETQNEDSDIMTSGLMNDADLIFINDKEEEVSPTIIDDLFTSFHELAPKASILAGSANSNNPEALWNFLSVSLFEVA
jgi:hypothetical protein